MTKQQAWISDMFNPKRDEDESNFWISYADLMAGLLFVFILLIGAIVSKSIILKSDLSKKEQRLITVEKDLKVKGDGLKSLNLVLEEKMRLIQNLDRNLTTNGQKLLEQEQKLLLNDEEIRRLNALLLEANTQRDKLNGEIVIVQNLLGQSKIEKLQSQKELDEYRGKVVILSNQLTENNKTVELKDAEMLRLMQALDEKETDYNKILQSLQEQKAQIKNLTGIKVKVIAALKKALGENITIDPKSGSLQFASNILFEKGSVELKEEAKGKLREVFEEYMETLMSDVEIRTHLENIVIEGHTDSDGGYLYNLDLSQRRAYEVMNYLLTLDFAQKNDIKPLMAASGRAFMDAIVVDGVEDKDASRRIEIKFRLKNEDAMHEIEKVLDAE
jgi:chemotaxis protein MotB